MLVHPDGHDDVPAACDDGVGRLLGDRRSGGTRVEDVDERDAGEAEQTDERVGLGDLPAPPERAVDVVPRNTGIRQRLLDRIGAHLERALVAVPAEGVQANPDDRYLIHLVAPQLLVGANANVMISSPAAFV